MSGAAQTLSRYREVEAALREPTLKQGLYDAGAVVMDGVLIVLHGEEHLRRRAIEVRVFRRNFLGHYEKQLFPATLEQTLAPYIEAGGGDLIALGYRATANLTADFAGIDRPRRTPEESEQLIRLVKKFSEGATLVHSTRPSAEVEDEVRAALAEFDRDFLAGSVARRRALLDEVAAGSLGDEALPRDVLTVILAAEDELQLAPDQLVREIAFYMQAGAHSTSNAVVHALAEMSDWAGDDPARWSELDDPSFAQRCVHESLRLHPASPEAWRVATSQIGLAGLTLRPGERVVLDLFNANRDPSVFGADAERFRPGRETPGGVLPAGLAFGMGVHACLGRELDGGVPARAGSDPATHQYGIVALIVQRLLALGARRLADDPPTPDLNTSRPNWGRFPVRFTRVKAMA